MHGIEWLSHIDKPLFSFILGWEKYSLIWFLYLSCSDTLEEVSGKHGMADSKK